MEQMRFVVEFECDGRVERVTLLAGSWRDVGRWLDQRPVDVSVVRIERVLLA